MWSLLTHAFSTRGTYSQLTPDLGTLSLNTILLLPGLQKKELFVLAEVGVKERGSKVPWWSNQLTSSVWL